MGLIRGLAGAVISVVALLLALVAVVLCVTVILLPLGLPLLAYAGRIFALALKLMLPRAVSHPVRRMEKALPTGHRKRGMNLSIPRPGAKSFGKRARKRFGGMRRKKLFAS